MRHQVARVAQGLTPSCRPSQALNSHTTLLLQPSICRRQLQINSYLPTQATPNLDSLENSPTNNLAPPTSGTSPDARFEVLGSTSSLLSIGLTASQNLYTRRGSLVGVSGSPDDAISTLSPLSPLTRAFVGIPFLYQKISSTTPINLLVATKSPQTSFSVVHLDGRLDWIVAQRKGLIAWTGHTLSVRPSLNLKMSLAHWGNTVVRGRGLIAVAGTGQIYQITLNNGEQYVAHPSNILAYTMNAQNPLPYRFKSTSLRLQLPKVSGFLLRYQFFRTMQGTPTWKFFANIIFTIRRWGRRTLFGDRLFLQFQGPQTILLQSRGSTLRDVLTARDVDEIAEAPPGVIYSAQSPAAARPADQTGMAITTTQPPPKLSYASVDKGRRVTFGNQ